MANVEPARHATARAVVLAGTLGLAAACWAAAAWLMRGMDMGLATRPGPFGFFAAAWVTMMAAMMLPGAAPGGGPAGDFRAHTSCDVTTRNKNKGERQ